MPREVFFAGFLFGFSDELELIFITAPSLATAAGAMVTVRRALCDRFITTAHGKPAQPIGPHPALVPAWEPSSFFGRAYQLRVGAWRKRALSAMGP